MRSALPFRTKWIAGASGMVDTLGVWVILSIAYPVLQIALGVSPFGVGLSLMVFRLWDAFSDPLMGWISDRSRTPWGRRRPFMLVGSVLSAITFPLLWWFDPAWGDTSILLWFTGFGILFYSCFTIWSVPYASLMLELSGDYDERTRLFSYRTVFQTIATLFLGSVWWLIHRIGALNWMPEADQVLSGIRMLSLMLAIPILVLGAAPAWYLKEPLYAVDLKTPRVRLFEGVVRAMRNPDVFKLLLMHALFLLGGGIGSGLSYYFTTFYLFQGSTETSAAYQGIGTVLFCASNIFGVWFFDRLSKRMDKAIAIRGAMGMLVIASLSSWVLYTPTLPSLHLLSGLMVGFGNAGFYMLGVSMLADLVDEDELANGSRIEGGFASLLAWSMKFSISLSFALSGLLISISGFDPESYVPGDPSLQVVRLLFVGFPAICVGCAIWLSCHLKTSRNHASRIRTALERKRASAEFGTGAGANFP